VSALSWRQSAAVVLDVDQDMLSESIGVQSDLCAWMGALERVLQEVPQGTSSSSRSAQTAKAGSTRGTVRVQSVARASSVATTSASAMRAANEKVCP